MACAKISFMGQPIDTPLVFSQRLPFQDADVARFPHLGQRHRYYCPESELSTGGRAVAYKGYICDSSGMRLPDTPDVVLKVPNLNIETYDAAAIKAFLVRQRDETPREFALTRSRLRNSDYANCLLDFGVPQEIEYLGDFFPMPVSVQPFLGDFSPLDKFLLDTGERTEPYAKLRGVSNDSWEGCRKVQTWIGLVRAITQALSDIHERRVVHGDIWPPNIFLQTAADKIHVKFIDFGESFPAEPKGDPQLQRDHAYRAPERHDATSIVTEQADIYSLGKLMLHLAVGEEPRIPNSIQGYERRKFIRDFFLRKKPHFLQQNPFLVDLICSCVAFDPVDRPSGRDILEAFQGYIDFEAPNPTQYGVSQFHIQLEAEIEKSKALLESKPQFDHLIGLQLSTASSALEGIDKGVLKVTDTREHLLGLLVSMFGQLRSGDSFISLTSPQLWQKQALGLDGRYFSSNLLALKRGASIQRCFVFSVQELGLAWGREWSQALERQLPKSEERGTRFVQLLNKEIAALESDLGKGLAAEVAESTQIENRLRLRRVLESYLQALDVHGHNLLDPMEEYGGFSATRGLFLGLLPTSSVAERLKIKATEPVSVFRFGGESQHHLLMTTDCSRRNTVLGTELGGPPDFATQHLKPELRAVTIFESALGIPEDRIKRLEIRMRQSVPAGALLKTLTESMPS